MATLILTIDLTLALRTILISAVISLAGLLIRSVRKADIKIRETATEWRNRSQVPWPLLSPAEKTLSLVIPAFDEEVRLPKYIMSCITYLQNRAARDPTFTFEILVVDDGSKDSTGMAAMAAARKIGSDSVTVIQLDRNKGKGAAVRKGVMSSRGLFVLFADADGATEIQEFEKLEKNLNSLLESTCTAGRQLEPKGVAVASRAHLVSEAIVKRSWYRNLLMYGFHLCVRVIVGSAIKDTQCGFKLFTRSAAQLIFPNLRLERWCFDVELIFLCQHFGIPMVEVPVAWTEVSGSKIRITSVIHMLFELGTIWIGYNLGFWKAYELR